MLRRFKQIIVLFHGLNSVIMVREPEVHGYFIARQMLPMTSALLLFCQFMHETQIQHICYSHPCYCLSSVQISLCLPFLTYDIFTPFSCLSRTATAHFIKRDRLLVHRRSRRYDVRSRDERRAWIILLSPRQWLIIKRKWLFIMIIIAWITVDMNPIKQRLNSKKMFYWIRILLDSASVNVLET